MPAHKTSERVLLRAKQVVEDCLREGYAPPDLATRGRAAHTEAVARLVEQFGCAEDTAWGWISRANKTEAFAPDYELYRPFQYQTFNKRHELGTTTPLKPGRAGQRVALIGDLHDSPSIPDKSRFYWIGRWLAEGDFDQVVQVGDWVTLDSLTRHAAPGTKTFADLPSFKQDLDSMRESLKELERGLGGKKIKKTVTLGNHEDRALRYEELNPQMVNLIHNQLIMLFEEFGWATVPYQEWYLVEGVAITHHVTNSLGRAFGGKTAGQRAANETVCSIIHGHTHQRQFYCASKVGPIGSVDVVSVGCGLPWGVVESYAKHGPSGWFWGVCSAHLVQGQIASFESISMLDMEARYGEQF